ncbi:MAG: translocation/assembly module TamB domain-containing protein [Endomicrobiaceae bacterium]
MWKKIRYALYFIVLIIVFSVTYSFREYYYVPALQNYVNKITSSKIQFRNFSFSFPFNISLNDIKYDNQFFINKATLRFEPLILLKNIKTPLKAFTSLNVDKIVYINAYVDKNDRRLEVLTPAKIKKLKKAFEYFNIAVFIKKADILYDNHLIKTSNTDIKFNKNIKLSTFCNYNGHSVNLTGNSNLTDTSLLSSFHIDVFGDIKALASLSGQYNLTNTFFEYKLQTNNLSINKLLFGKTSTLIQKDKNGLIINASGDFGNLSYSKEPSADYVWKSSGTVILKDANDLLHTLIDYSATMQNSLLNVSIKARNTKLLGNDFGTFDIEADNNNDTLNLACRHNTTNTFSATIKKNGTYDVDIYTKKNKTGKMSGNYKTGEISIDIRKIPITKMPFLSSFKKLKGFVSIYGNIGKTHGSLLMEAKNISSKKLKQFDTFGKISKENSRWIFDIETKDKKLIVKGFYETKKHHNIEFYYSGVDSNNLLQILGFKPHLSGLATGYIKYDSNKFTQIDISLKKGALFGNKFNDWTILGNISPSTINISSFTFKGKKTSIDLKALLDFTKNAPDSYLDCDISNFKFNNININSHILFNGKIAGDMNEIIGKLHIPMLQLNDSYFNDFSSDINLSTNMIHMRNIDNKNGLEGELAYNFKTKKISSDINITKADLSYHFKNLEGFLNSSITLNGILPNPEFEITANIKKGVISFLNYALNTKIIRKNGKTILKNLDISSDKASLTARGIIDRKKTKIKINFKKITEELINKYMNSETPLSGTFYGSGIIAGKLSDLKAYLNLSSDIMYIKSVKFHSLNSKITVDKRAVSIKQANVKTSDTEINILSGILNRRSGSFSSVLNVVNAHLGPFDIFGNIKITGNKNNNGYKGYLELDNIWLNRAKISELKFNYTLSNKKIILDTPSKQDMKISGAINFSNYPKLKFEKFAICYGSQICNFTGSSTTSNLNVNLEGKSLDSEILTDIFDLPFDMSGSINVKLKAAGSISKPVISCSLNSKKGRIHGIPYDTFNVNLNARNNILNINEFKIQKKDEYTAKITGFLPFWIDPELKNRLINKKLNIRYEIIDTKLTTLKNLAQDNINTKKGNLKLQGLLSGTRKKISNTGKLNIEASNITTNSYIHKIKNLNIDIIWKNGIFEVKKFLLKAGSGTLTAEGKIKLNGLTPYFYDLSVFTSKKGIPIIIHELPIPTSGLLKIEKTNVLTNFSKGNPKFNFKLRGNSNNLSLTGQAELKNTRFCYPSPIDNAGSGSLDLGDLFKNLTIDIDLIAASDTRYENTFANVFLKGKLNLKGKFDKISANGIIESNNGILSYMGNEFDVINTKIEIINNEMFISGEADTQVFSSGTSEAEVIKVQVDRSSVKDIKTRFISKDDPTMESNKVLARLTKTDPSEDNLLDTSTDYLVKQQIVRLFGSNIATPLANTVLKKTGIVDNVRLGYINQDNLQVDSKEEPTIAELLYGMKYSVEKNINRLLLVGYSVTFDQIEREIDLKHAVEMSFRLNKDLFLKGTYGLQSNNPLYEPEKKLMIEQRIKFGGPSKD